jgi:hypothetical protein
VTCSSSRLGSAICDTTPPCSAWQQTQVTPLSPYLPFHSLMPDSFLLCLEIFLDSPTKKKKKKEKERSLLEFAAVILLKRFVYV